MLGAKQVGLRKFLRPRTFFHELSHELSFSHSRPLSNAGGTEPAGMMWVSKSFLRSRIFFHELSHTKNLSFSLSLSSNAGGAEPEGMLWVPQKYLRSRTCFHKLSLSLSCPLSKRRWRGASRHDVGFQELPALKNHDMCHARHGQQQVLAQDSPTNAHAP